VREQAQPRPTCRNASNVPSRARRAHSRTAQSVPRRGAYRPSRGEGETAALLPPPPAHSFAASKPRTVRHSNIKGSNKDEWGPAGQFVGFFRPPVSSNYSFISAADDLSRVWINVDTRNMSKMQLLLDTKDWMPSRDW
jgi:hypothetical protein